MEENIMMNAATNDVMTNEVATNEVVKTVYVGPSTVDKIKYAGYGALATLAICWVIGRKGKKKEAKIRAQAVNKAAAANVEPGTTDFQEVAEEK